MRPVLIIALAVSLCACTQEPTDDSPSKASKPAAQTPPAKDKGDANVPEPEDAPKPESPAVTVVGADDPRVKARMEAEDKGESSTETPLTEPLSIEELRTTSCNIYMGNLKGAVEAQRKLVAKFPDRRDHRLQLANALYQQGQVFGDLDLMAAGLVETTVLLEKDPTLKEALAHVQIASSLHAYAEATRALEVAEALKPGDATVAAARERLTSEQGMVTREMLETQSKAYEQGANTETYIAAAQAREQLGDRALADRYFAMAERAYADVSPIAVSWINIQRGLLAMHGGEFPQAKVFFDAAYERCPEYPMASEHLAEIEGRLGNTERSIELYRAVVEQTDNPEFIAALAETLQAAGQSDEAKSLTTRAATRNQELLGRHPTAMFWHGAEFYLGLGDDPAKALELLQKNAELRPGAHAYQALAEALLANGKLEEAAAASDKALELPVDFAEKHWTAARIATAKGDTAAATEQADVARKMNPRIEDLEGPLASD